MSREHLDVGDLVEKSSLERQRELCGIGGELHEKKWGPDPNDLSDKERKIARSMMGDIASELDVLRVRLGQSRDKIGEKLTKLFAKTSVGGRPEFGDLKKASAQLDQMEELIKKVKHTYEQAETRMR